MSKLGKISLISLGVFLSLLIFILFTPAGLNSALWATQKISHNAIKVKTAHGILAGNIRATGIEYTTQYTTIKIDAAVLKWNPFALLIGKLNVRRILANTVEITHVAAPPSKSTSTPKKISLPISIIIDNGAIEHLHYNHDYRLPHIDIHQLALTSRHINGTITLRMIDPYRIDAKLKLGGNPNAYQFNLTLYNSEINWRLIGSGTQHSIAIQSDRQKMLGGQFRVNASLEWEKQISWSAKINIHELQLKQIQKDWPQQIDFDLNTDGNWQQPNLPDFNINAHFSSVDTHIFIQGDHHQRWNLNWKVSVPRLAHWLPQAVGELQGDGRIVGPSLTPTISGDMHALNFNLFGYQAQKLDLNGYYDFSYTTAAHVALKADEFRTPLFFLNSFKLNLMGHPESHQLVLTTTLFNKTLGASKLRTVWQGSLDQSSWNAIVKEFDFSSQHFGHWQLNHTVNLLVNKNQVTFTPFCVTSARNGKTCMQGDWLANKPWSFSATFNRVDLTPIFEHLWPGLSMRGSADFSAQVSGNGSTIQQGATHLVFHNAKLSYNGENGLTQIPFNQASWTVNYAKQILNSDLDLSMSSTNYIRSKITLNNLNLSDPTFATTTLQGGVDAELGHLEIFNIFISDIFNPKGRLNAHFKLSGTLAKPVIGGNAKLLNGNVAITDAKINLTNLNANIKADNAQLDYTVKAYSDDQPITVSGKTDFSQTGFPTKLSIKANNILVINTVEYQIHASPDLVFEIKGNKAALNGTIYIPSALLAPLSFSRTVSLPTSTVIIGGPDQNSNEPVLFESNVKIKLGDNVKVQAGGLKGNLTGAIDVTRKQHQAILANGSLQLIKGSFSTHGKTLEITNGSGVSYANSPLFNPTLNVRATKTISINPSNTQQVFSANHIVVGVQLAGTLHTPIVSLFSIPSSISQADILSYLLFGTPSNTNGPGNISILLDAVTSLNLDNSENTSAGSQISQGLGFTEFGVEQQTSIDALGTPLGYDQSSFVVGRYLTPKIYLRYSRGLNFQIDIFQVRYLFSQNWAVQTETSALGTGGDILYTIQR